MLNRLLLVFALLLAAPLALLSTALPSSAQERRIQCIGAVGNLNIANHTSFSEAISIDRNATVPLALRADGNIGQVMVTLSAGPWSRSIAPATDRASRPVAWNGVIDVADYAVIGSGLYEVSVRSTGGCDLSFWVNVTGASAASTPVGGGATVTLLAGLASQAFGLFRGARGKKGLLWAVLGGIPTGLAACVLAQQSGLTPITPVTALMWTIPPASIGGVLEAGLSAFFGRCPASASPAGGGAAPSYPPPDAPRPTAPVPSSSPSRPVPPSASDGRPPSASPSTEPVATPAADNADDPPRTAFALLECPGVVTAGVEFQLDTGLSATPVEGVSGGALVRPESSVGSYILTVQVVADGFTLREGERWRRDLLVTRDEPYPKVTLHLTPDPQTEAVRARAIEAIYSTGGHSMGLAVRPVAVVAAADLLSSTEPPVPEPRDQMSIPIAYPAADLTVRIQRGDSEAGGRLLWTFDTPYPDIEVPDAPRTTDIGNEPEKFARLIVDGVTNREGQAGLRSYLVGIGRTIADQMPLPFWDLLRKTAARAQAQGRRPSVFLLSEEPYVPWELAVVEPALDANTPAFLGAQVCIGRWILGQRRPTLPAPTAVDVRTMAVVAGVYRQPGWARLVEAEQEAEQLTRSYGAASVLASSDGVLRALDGVPPAEVLHFAVHGIYDPESVANGIVLTDGLTLDPLQVKGSMLSAAPFVFLNACQLGSANRILGDYGGMAEAFLYAGASAVIAPFWSISDTVARDLALSFYRDAFDGVAPSEVLRRSRARFNAEDAAQSSTCLAYVLYGHPSLQLSRRAEARPVAS